ncbi:hypothetical protein D3C75_275440 [compost metagenome]
MADACLDVFLLAASIHDRRVLFRYAHLTGVAELVNCRALQVQTQLLGDHLAACQSCDILQHCFTAVAEARSLNGNSVERSAQLVHDQHSLSFAFDVFSDDQQRTGLLYDLLKQRQDFLSAADLLVGDQDVRIIQNGFHLVRVGNHVRGDVTAVELHAFNHFKLGQEAAGFFNGDNAVFAHFFHSFSDQFAHFFVSCGDSGNLCDGLGIFNWLGDALKLGNSRFNGFVDTFAQSDWAGAGGYVLQTFADQGLCKHGCGSRTVAGNIVCLGRNFFNELSAHVLKRVFQFDFLGDCYTVVRDERAAEFLLQHHVAAFRSKSHFNRISQSVHTAKHCTAGVFTELDIFCHYQKTSL